MTNDDLSRFRVSGLSVQVLRGPGPSGSWGWFATWDFRVLPDGRFRAVPDVLSPYLGDWQVFTSPAPLTQEGPIAWPRWWLRQPNLEALVQSLEDFHETDTEALARDIERHRKRVAEESEAERAIRRRWLEA